MTVEIWQYGNSWQLEEEQHLQLVVSCAGFWSSAVALTPWKSSFISWLLLLQSGGSLWIVIFYSLYDHLLFLSAIYIWACLMSCICKLWSLNILWLLGRRCDLKSSRCFCKTNRRWGYLPGVLFVLFHLYRELLLYNAMLCYVTHLYVYVWVMVESLCTKSSV